MPSTLAGSDAKGLDIRVDDAPDKRNGPSPGGGCGGGGRGRGYMRDGGGRGGSINAKKPEFIAGFYGKKITSTKAIVVYTTEYIMIKHIHESYTQLREYESIAFEQHNRHWQVGTLSSSTLSFSRAFLHSASTFS
jgi:hypothetical protein